MKSRIYETLFEYTIQGISFRIWMKGEGYIDESILRVNLSHVVSSSKTVREMVDRVADLSPSTFAAIQVRREGTCFSTLLYLDWP